MIDHRAQGCIVIRERKEIVEIYPAVRGPRQMFRNALRLIALAQVLQARKMRPVEALARTDVQSNAMQRKRVIFPDESELRVRDASSTHIVFGMDLEESNGLRA